MTTTNLDVLARHRTDLAAARDGIWIDIDGDQFLVAKLGSPRTSEFRSAFLAEHGLKPDADVPPHLLESWSAKMFGHCILLDIKPKGVPDYRYHPGTGELIASSPDLQDLWIRIMEVARGPYNREWITRHAILGNSEPSSNGSTSTATSETPSDS